MSKTIRLSQVIALDSGARTRVQKELTELHRKSSKPELFNGSYRRFESLREDEGEKPPESKLVQLTADKVLQDLRELLSGWFDAVLTKDYGNVTIMANVACGSFVLEKAPIPTILFLEKQLEDLRKFVESLPLLDPAQAWSKDENRDLYVAPDTYTLATKKVAEVLVKFPATTEHPAQTEVVTLDRPVGKWVTTLTSGAISGDRRREILRRINAMAEALKTAREEANAAHVDQRQVSAALFNYIFS